MLGLALGRQTEKAWSRPVGAGDSLCDGSEGRIGFAIEPIAVVDYLDLVGPAIPLADEMGAGRNGPCGSAGAWCPVRHGGQSAPGCGRKPAHGSGTGVRARERGAGKHARASLEEQAPKVCSQTRRKLAKSKPSKTTFRPTPVSCGITERSLFCSIKSSLMRDFRVRSSLPVARPAADLIQPCAPPVGLSLAPPAAQGSEASPAARNTLDSARIPRASKLLICGLFQKGRVLAQDGVVT